MTLLGRHPARCLGLAVLLGALVGGATLPAALPAVPPEAVGVASADAADASARGCLAVLSPPLQRRRFALEGRCRGADEREGCAYHDLREVRPGTVSGVDERGITGYQVTFPGQEHLWAMLSVREPPGSRFCWLGGALVGRNPLAMTWSTPTGTKRRKNNFLLSEGGRIVVEGARVHNAHDAFLADGEHAGFAIDGSWISWNRDDLFEGYLHDLSIEDTLVDGTYTFISDPDGDCDAAKAAHDSVVVIERSLIRLQRQPGPYARHTPRWHLAPEGGHNTLWKLDSCDWKRWPKFVLRDNVFLIDGPRTTGEELNRADCRLALPGDCGAPLSANLVDCSNNLFLYTDYRRWVEKGREPGPVPEPGGPFHNADNPRFLPNGEDCYQRLTDEPRDAGYADVPAVWRSLRERWLRRHAPGSGVAVPPMHIPGVDHPPFAEGTPLTLANRGSGECLSSLPDGGVAMRRCDGSNAQRFELDAFDDGKLAGAVLLKDAHGRYVRSPPPPDGGAAPRYWPLLAEAPLDGGPDFVERWYLLPLEELGPTERPLFAVESDVIGRSFLRTLGERAAIQSLYVDGPDTPLPQPRFSHGDDAALQWYVAPSDVSDLSMRQHSGPRTRTTLGDAPADR